MANVKDFTGAVNISDDITPITRQKIDQVTPEDWLKMDISTLWDQRITLSNRMVMALQSGHYDIAKQVQSGVNRIDVILQMRDAAETKDDGLV